MTFTFNIVGNGQMSQGAVNGPQDIADMFVKLVELAKKTNEPQQYISTSFSMSITVLP